MTTAQQPIHVAIIGSGIAGLSMAYYLSHPDQNGAYVVTIYESHHRLGLDSQSITFVGDGFADGTFTDPIPDQSDNQDGAKQSVFTSWLDENKELASPVNMNKNNKSCPQPPRDDKKFRVRIDMPLRVFSTRYYPHLTTLLESLGVVYQSENYEASFSQFDGTNIFKYKNLLLGPFSIPYVNPTDLFTNPVARDIIRFLNCAPADLRNGRLQPPPGLVTTFDLLNEIPGQKLKSSSTQPASATQQETLLEYLVTEGYSEEFIYSFEIPTVASICTCSYESAAKYPAYVIIQYQTLRNGGGVRRVKSGISKVVAGLSQYVTNIRTSCAVTSIRYLEKQTELGQAMSVIPPPVFKQTITDPTDLRSPGSPIKSDTSTDHVEVADSTGEKRIYDHLIFATQANQTCKILNRALFGAPPTPFASTSALNNNSAVFATAPISTTSTDKCSEPQHTRQNAPRNWYKIYDALSKIPYEASELILHGDERFLPPNRDDWANVNFLLPPINEIKDFTHSPLQITPSELTPEVVESGLVALDSYQPDTGPVIITDQVSDTSLLPHETLLIPSDFASPAQGHQNLAPIPSPNALSTDLSQPNLCRQFSDNWLHAIERQPSARAQRHALVMGTKVVSQSEGMSTIWMNKVQSGINPNANIFQTWNPYCGIIGYGKDSCTSPQSDEKADGQTTDQPKTMSELIKNRAQQNFGTESVKDLYGRSFFQRPIVTFDSIDACRDLWELNGKANIWCIGSFALGGVPLLESGVASAFVVASKLGAKPVMQPTETVKDSTLSTSTAVQDVNGKARYPILGWVNNASSANRLLEFIIWIVFNILWICGVYRTNVDPKDLYPHNKAKNVHNTSKTKQD